VRLKLPKYHSGWLKFNYNEPKHQEGTEFSFWSQITNIFNYNVNLIHVNPPQLPYVWKKYGNPIWLTNILLGSGTGKCQNFQMSGYYSVKW